MAHPAILSINKPLRITGIDIRNYKKIKAFSLEIAPDDTLITIGGENENGKSTVLDAIESTIVGIIQTQTMPIRDGAESGGIKLIAPPYEFKRLFTPEGTSLKITRTDDGTEVQDKKTLLNQLMGDFFVRPMTFLTATPIQQRRQLEALVGIDMDSIDASIEESRRTERQLDEHQKKVIARVDLLPWHDDAPEALVSVAELSEHLRAIHEHNNGVEQARNAVTLKRQSIASTEESLDRAAAEIERLKRQLAEAEGRKSTLEDTLAGANQELTNLQAVADGLQAKPFAEIEAQISGAEAENQKFRENEAKATAKKEWDRAEAELGEAISATKQLEAEKKRLLSEAAFPVEGLSFDATQILLNGIPFRQASSAQRVRTAIAIALAMRGQLAPILINDASILDKKLLRLIVEEAERRGAQVFAEIVTNLEEKGFDEDCSVYIVDGGNTEIQWRGPVVPAIEGANSDALALPAPDNVDASDGAETTKGATQSA